MSDFIIYDPLSLLNTKRFDICAKVLYAKYKVNNINCNFAERVYLRHIELWNGFFEAQPLKKSSDDFIISFDHLLTNISHDGFTEPEINYVPIKNSSVYNGAHRVAASIVYNVPVHAKEDSTNGCEVADYNYFNSLGLEQQFSDEMVLEFIRRKKNSFTISIFSSDKKQQNDIIRIISEYSDILCFKDVELTELGKKNYIISLYLGEKWLGDHTNSFSGASGKYSSCFRNSNKMRVYVVTTNQPERLIECKQKIRSLYNEANHSVHINDTYKETWRISSLIFNQNSLNFINTQNRPTFTKFNQCFNNYKNTLDSINDEFFCVTSSAVLSLYSLRDCNDIDFLTSDRNYMDFKSSEVSSHESEIKYYSEKDRIIFEPSQHLYFDGFKFSTIQNVYDFKSKRREAKDILDCELIKNKNLI